MNKKVLSILLALAMVLSMAPVSLLTAQEVSAESILTTSPSDHDHSHPASEGWEAWGDEEDETGMPTATGKYYIAVDEYAPTTADLRTPNVTVDITICLNGKTVTAPSSNRLYLQNDECNITFCDCTATVDAEGKLQATNKLVPSNAAGSIVQFQPMENKAGYFTMENIVVDGTGVTNTNGGMLYRNTNAKGELHMENCVVKNCNVTSSGTGGVIQSNNGGGVIKANNVVFQNNSAAGGGGVVYNAANSTATTNYTFTNCRFEGNQSSSGGGVIRNHSGGTLTMTDCTFLQNKVLNTSGYGGAAILSAAGGIKLQISGCDFTENSSAHQGGAIAINSGNSASTIADSTFTDNHADNIGGAIFIQSSTLAISGSDFTGNTTASSKNGSAIYAHAAGNTLTLTDCEITGNTAGGLGAIASPAAVNVIGNTRIYGNSASASKSADVYLTGSNKLTLGTMGAQAKINVATAEDSTDANTFMAWASGATPTAATGVTYTNTDPVQTVAYNETNGFIFQTKQLEVPEGSDSYHDHDVDGWTEWDGTTALADGGKYYLTDDVTYNQDIKNMTVTVCLNGHNITAKAKSRLFQIYEGGNVTVCDCQASFNENGELESANRMIPSDAAGSIATLRLTSGATDAPRSLTMEYVTVDGTGTTASANGCRGILTWHKNSTVSLTGCVFRNMAGGTTAATYPGGAVSMYSGGTLNADNVLWENNTEGYLGGGAIYTASSSSKLNLTDCEFTGNSAKDGGAICMNGATTTVMTGCTFTENEGESGGAVKIKVASDTTVENCVFDSNRATSTASTGSGGAINADIESNKLTLTGGSFTNNSATGGGAISLNGDLSANGTSFTGNKSIANGGALFPRANIGTVTLTDCPFESNTASGFGGAISIHANTMTLTGCDFTGNISYNTVENGGGGAIYGYRGVNATDCTFTENRANFNGGAIYSCHNLYLTDCTLTGNTANNLGGGVFYDSTNMNVMGTTKIEDNTTGSTEQNVYLASTRKMKLSALDTGASVGVTAADTAEGTAVATVSDTTYQAGMIFSDVAERYVDGDADGATALSLKTASAIVGGVGYPNIGEAAAANGGTVTLNGNVAENATLPAEVVIDMNGKTVADGVVLTGAAEGTVAYIADSTLTYDSASPVVIDKENLVNVTIPDSYKVGNRRYVAIDTGDTYTIHRVQMTVTAKALRPSNTGVGFKVRFSAAESIPTEYLKGFGVKFDVMNGTTVVKENADIPMGVTISNGKDLTVVLTDFLESPEYATYTVIGTPYIKLDDGTVVAEGTPVEMNFKDMVLYADENYNTLLTKAQQDAITEMCNGAYKETFAGWNLQNIVIQ